MARTLRFYRRLCAVAFVFMAISASLLLYSMVAVGKVSNVPREGFVGHLEPSRDKLMMIEVKGEETYAEAETRVRTEPKKVDHIPGVTKTISTNLLPRAEKVCEKVGLAVDPCARDLVAMVWKETTFRPLPLIADGGRSHGYFQIQIKLHNVSKDCANDFECAATWTVKNLIKNGYPTMRSASIAKHNGGGVAAKKYAEAVKAYSIAMLK